MRSRGSFTAADLRGQRRSVWWAALLTLVLPAIEPARGQSLWELSPYQIKVWLTIATHPRIPADWQAQLKRQLEIQATSQVGAVWNLVVEAAPAALQQDLQEDRLPDWQMLVEKDPALRQTDKLFLLKLDPAPAGYGVTVSELDLHTQVWSPPLERSVPTLDQLGPMSLEMLCDAFVPVAQIVRVRDEDVTAVLRAGALLRPAQSARSWKVPTRVDEGQVLQPVIVRSDRNGQVVPGGARPIDWTLLLVKSRQDSTLECQFYSGYRQPFSTRRSARVSQLAFLVKPRSAATELHLVDRQNVEQPLVGYDIYSRPPGTESSEFLGRSDWRGRLSIAADPAHPVRVLFVRSGTQLLGKLPLVPGAQPVLRAPLRNDDQRLEAEGFLLGIQESLVDLVARREVISSRIRKRIEDGALDEAEQLLNELRQLDTQEEFERRVQQRKQSLTNVSADVQQKIDQLFAETHTLLARYLDPKRVQELQTLLDGSRSKTN